MPSRRPADRFGDIIANIDTIAGYTAGMDEAHYLADRKTQDATIACFARISEAATKLGSLAEQLAPDEPWGEVRGLGNVLRHELVQPRVLWRTITNDLALLRAACERAIRQIEEGKGGP